MAVKQIAQTFPVHGAGGLTAVEFLSVYHCLDRVKVSRGAYQPLHRVARLRERALPKTQGFEDDFAPAEGVKRALRRAERAAIPHGAAILAPQSKSRQRAAIVQVHADPVPAPGFGVQQFIAPFMVQPGFAADFKALPAQCDLPAGGQLRLAVVVAGLARVRPLAGQTLLAL